MNVGTHMSVTDDVMITVPSQQPAAQLQQQPTLEVNESGATDEQTCFLCCLRFSSQELCRQHKHHVHMRWVDRTLHDYSEEELPGSSKDILPVVVLPPHPQQDEFGVITLPSQDETAEAMKLLPTDEDLPKIGFPSKLWHYCHLCTHMFKSYRQYYLHMHSRHGLEKRYQCIITGCGRTFLSGTAFQNHTGYHNQKSECCCNMCDLVFGDPDKLKEHQDSADHFNKCWEVQAIRDSNEPHNYCCKICRIWFGLFTTFMNHMETEDHQYQCQHCGLLFVQPEQCFNHIQIVHPKEASMSGGVKRRGDHRPLLEECTDDLTDDNMTRKLPNTIRLVESKLPLSKAENRNEFFGKFLFLQIYSPKYLKCLFCGTKKVITTLQDLEKHYNIQHELNVHICKAVFDGSYVFECVPSDVAETNILNLPCQICLDTLHTQEEVQTHYLINHLKNVHLIQESAVADLSTPFYCSFCFFHSHDFATHHEHMKNWHQMQTYRCKFCTFCTHRPTRLRSHVKECHLHCPVCRGSFLSMELLNNHMLLSHATQKSIYQWSCMLCQHTCSSQDQLKEHFPHCPRLPNKDTPKEKMDQSMALNMRTRNLFYQCSQCSLTFSEEEIRKHMNEGTHMPVTDDVMMTSQQPAAQLKQEGANQRVHPTFLKMMSQLGTTKEGLQALIVKRQKTKYQRVHTIPLEMMMRQVGPMAMSGSSSFPSLPWRSRLS